MLSSANAGSGGPCTTLFPRSTHNPPCNFQLEISEERSSYISGQTALTPSPNRNRSQNHSAQRPWTTCQISVFGPQSSISHLDPLPRAGPSDRAKVLHRSAWFHLPGRYPIKHPDRQICLNTDMMISICTSRQTDMPKHKQAGLPQHRQTDRYVPTQTGRYSTQTDQYSTTQTDR